MRKRGRLRVHFLGVLIEKLNICLGFRLALQGGFLLSTFYVRRAAILLATMMKLNEATMMMMIIKFNDR